MPFADSQGLSIHFTDTGAGPPIVLGHSFLYSGEMWREQLPVLATRHRVLNLDLRGHGRSGEVRQPFSLYDAVADVVAVLDELGIEKATWCGLSIGGMVALRAALTCPQRVGALILLDTDAGAESALHRFRYAALGLGVRVTGARPFAAPIARLMFGATTRRQNPGLVGQWKDHVPTLHVPSVLHGLRAILSRDSLLACLPQIRIPALVMVGEEDRTLPPVLSQRIHDLLPDSRLVRIPGAGHLAALEQPAVVNREILEFLDARAD